MSSDDWSGWTGKFQRGHLTSIVLSLMEGMGPLRIILAQGMLAFSPFFGRGVDSSWTAFAEILEDPEKSRTFAEHLRQEKP